MRHGDSVAARHQALVGTRHLPAQQRVLLLLLELHESCSSAALQAAAKYDP